MKNILKTDKMPFTICAICIILFIQLLCVDTIADEKTSRSYQAVQLTQGYMEVVDEKTCSDSLIRLSCRSLYAFIFVIEATYFRKQSTICLPSEGRQNQSKRATEWRIINDPTSANKRIIIPRQLRGNYIQEENNGSENQKTIVDLRKSINKKCSGHHHCRFSMARDHPGGSRWPNAHLRIKYACIPEESVRRYCNLEIQIKPGEKGYIKSPGYPLYYLGEYPCFWRLTTYPGQKISLNFHDFNLREKEMDGKCADLLRIQDNSNTVFEACGTQIGSKIVSNSSRLTLHLISTSKIYPTRGILLEYQASSATILKADAENNRLSSLTGDNINSQGVRIGREGNPYTMESASFNRDSTASAMIKESDYLIDVLLPTILMALLFVGNTVIVYLIFQYRKRKIPHAQGTEEITLHEAVTDTPQV